MNASPKGHHIVPRLHLQYFAGQQPRGQVWTYDKDTGAMRSAIPEETCVFTHFYSAQREDGTYDARIEQALAENEGNAAPIYERLVAGQLPTDNKDRSDFAIFIAFLYLRTHAQRQDAANLLARSIQIHNYAFASDGAAFDKLTEQVEADRGEKMPDDIKEEVRRLLLDPSGLEVAIRKEQTFLALSSCEPLARLLLNMNWTIVRPRNGFFITSDNPVIKCVEPKTISAVYGDGGFTNRTAQVTLALTPQVMLMMTPRDDFPRQAVIERQLVEFWNEQRAYYAEKYLYAHLQHIRLRQLATRLKGSRPVITTTGFGPKKFGKTVVPRRWNDVE